jgi:hypothetical protein
MSNQGEDGENVVHLSGMFKLPAGLGYSIPDGSDAELRIQSESFEDGLDDFEEVVEEAGIPYEREENHILVGGSKSGKTNGGDSMDYTEDVETEYDDDFEDIVGYVVDILEESGEKIESYEHVARALKEQVEERDDLLDFVNERLDKTYDTVEEFRDDFIDYLDEECNIEEYGSFAEDAEGRAVEVAEEMGISEDAY